MDELLLVLLTAPAAPPLPFSQHNEVVRVLVRTDNDKQCSLGGDRRLLVVVEPGEQDDGDDDEDDDDEDKGLPEH